MADPDPASHGRTLRPGGWRRDGRRRGRPLAWVALILAGLVGAAVVAMAWAHVSIRAVDPEIPDWSAVLAAGAAVPDAERPARLAWVNTARQPTPRSLVLSRHLDPDPDAPYVLAIPAFVLEWADGRGLLVDAGMDEEAARALGRIFQWGGAGPLEPLTSLARALGAGVSGDLAIAFTHLHVDHTQGVAALCAARGTGAAAVLVHRTRDQAERSNYTTRSARRQIAEAPCLEGRRLADEPLAAVPGRPGAFVVRAAGHTPGSQIVVAFLAGASRPHVFVGDVANHATGIRNDIPKPAAYRWLITPEAEARLGRLRRWLRAADEDGAVLLVSHDEAQLAGLALGGPGLEGPDPDPPGPRDRRFAPEGRP